MAVTGSINMSGDLYKDIIKKLDTPATAGTEGQVLGLNSSLNPVWMDQTGGAEIDDTAGAGDTDVTFSADKLTADHSSLLNAITQNSTEELLLRDELPGTTTVVTLDGNSNPTSIIHSANGETVRTDVFVWSTDSVTETRTASDKYITITTNLETLAQTISAVQEVA